MSERVAIALGSNLGDSEAILNGAIAALCDSSPLRDLRHSRWYRTKAVGPPQPDYLNGCAIARTTWEPQALLTWLLQLETQFGRLRGQRWGARTLDLDLLLYGDRILDTPQLQLPHPRMGDRAFVLVPLAEIAPDWHHPVAGQSVEQLRCKIDCSDVRLAAS